MVLRWKSTRRPLPSDPSFILASQVEHRAGTIEASTLVNGRQMTREVRERRQPGVRFTDQLFNTGERNPTNVRLCSLLPCTQCEETHENIYCRQAHYVQCSICNALVGSKGERRGRDLRTLEQSRVLNCVWSAPAPQVTIDDCNGVQNVLLFCHLALNSLSESNFEILHVVCSQRWILDSKIFADNSDNCWRSTFSKE